MEDTTQPQVRPTPKASYKKRFMIIVVSTVMVILVASITVFFIRRAVLINEVTSVLATVPAAMTAVSESGGNGFPTTLPNGIKKDSAVKLSGGGTFDGTIYCVTGTSLQDQTVTYHIDSTSKKPTQGECQPFKVTIKPTTAPLLSMTLVDTTQIGLVWPAIDNAASYTLQCATNTDYTQDLVRVTSASTAQKCSNLKPGLQYYARVRANSSAEPGPWSASLNVKTSAWSSAPTAIILKDLSSTSFSYSWPPIAGAIKYELEWASDTSYLQNVGTREQSATTGTVTNLKPGTQYYFHVKAITPGFDKSHAAYSDTFLVATPAS